MIRLRPAAERGHFDHGWLETWHSFSFAAYHDLEHMGFRALRVINEDRVQPGEGFGRHPHRDMEILTYIVSGALEHRDSTGGSGVLRRGDVQCMSAGSGVEHSEINPSLDEVVHLLQIWILPAARGTTPRYDQRHFPDEEKRGRLCPLATPQGLGGSLPIGQDASVYASVMDPGTALHHELENGRHAWVQLVRGSLDVAGTALRAGDGVAISDVVHLELRADEESELLLFDLA